MPDQTRTLALGKALFAASLMLAAVVPAFGQGYQSAPSNVGYIDNAIPTTMFRQRFDASFDVNRPDRAEFQYIRQPESRLDSKDLATYLEYAFNDCFSAFVEGHVHFVQPELNNNYGGLGDMNLGFKWAFLRSDDQAATFQLRTYIPTANPEEVLGNGHVSVEPGLLLFQRLSERLILEGEFKDWIPISENNFAGNIIRYGLGMSYSVYERCGFKIAPVVETVGWTVLSGKETVVSPSGVAPVVIPPGENTGGFPVKSAAGDTIVNVKLGVRINLGQWGGLYAGYGRALTGTVWYKDTFRLEYRLTF
jgi:hypothetical protein